VSKSPSQATVLVSVAAGTEGLEPFRTAGGEAYGLIPRGTHRECWPVRSTAFRRWLQRLFFDQTGEVPGGRGLQDALGVLEGTALYRGEEHDVHVRIADDDGATYGNLADEARAA
jgi:hypothetical protein